MLIAPTSEELKQHPLVQQALASAWADSLPDDPAQRHEEGGWIYMDVSDGSITIRRAYAGEQEHIDLSTPVIVSKSVIVGKFHTHPNPTDEGWNPGPSHGDLVVDMQDGVPDLIMSDRGVFVSGPRRRRGGLGGSQGYPL